VVENKPQYQETPKPAYPALARRMGYQGTVELELLVAVEGTVGAARLVRSSGYTLLDSAALKAVRVWRFEPGTRDGQQVAMWIKVPVNFSLR
jgi:protein TonB